MKAMKPLSQQECIPVGCVPSARYRTGGSLSPLWTENPPGQRPSPQTETPADRDLPPTETAGQRPPWTEIPLTETPLERAPPGQRQ